MRFFAPGAFRAGTLISGSALALSLVACSPTSPTTPAAPPIEQSEQGLPSAHVHGLSVNGDTGQVLLATHDGLFDVTKEPASKIGGTNDLMGFTAGTNGVFYASGHPGAGSDLPNPLGLLKSTDGGKTWQKLSRQGESDFHAMTTTKSGIVAFDGQLRSSPDGKTWNTVAAMFAPAELAGHPEGDTVLGTTPEGIQRSTDAGETWTLDKAAPVIQFAAFANPTEAAGVAPDGTTFYTADAGATWVKKGRIEGEVQAIAATKGADRSPWVWAATTGGIVVSKDGGVTFRPAAGA